MKYPQLVSARAVSAISDWLVTRLEQLGVDAPLIYSRLLLSLLHTPLQINALDLAELSDINIGNFGKKGNRRFSSSDTDTLKRIAAVESLIEAVAADQTISNIESLVDELCEKLREIEKQQEDSYYYTASLNNREVSSAAAAAAITTITASSKASSASVLEENMRKLASPEDPTKRYYRAFPALSKDLSTQASAGQNQVSIMPKSLSWPSESSNTNNSAASKNFKNINVNNNNNASNKSILSSSSAAGVKRKPRRRRNQALSKSKSSYGRKSGSGCSSMNWDTDFEGSWEMGRDLIREFVMHQNSRNRSISESDASKFVEFKDIINSKRDGGNLGVNSKLLIKNIIASSSATATTDDIKQHLFNNFSAEPNNMMLPSSILKVNDIEKVIINENDIETSNTFNSLSKIETAPRRLYEREVSNESINTTVAEEEEAEVANNLALFKAKFDRNVEALWDTTKTDHTEEKPSTNVQSFWLNYYKHHYNSNDPNETHSLFAPSTNNTMPSPLLFQQHNVNQLLSLDEQQQKQPKITLAQSANMLPRNLFDTKDEANLLLQQSSTTKPLISKLDILQSDKNLISSIWSSSATSLDNKKSTAAAATEEDVSFYSNVVWNTAIAAVENVMQSSKMNIVKKDVSSGPMFGKFNNNEFASSTINNVADSGNGGSSCGFLSADNTNFGGTTTAGYDMSNLSKWSDCAYESPYRQSSASNQVSSAVGNLRPSQQLESAGTYSLVHNDDKMRANLFENSYIYDYKSLPVMNNFKQNDDKNLLQQQHPQQTTSSRLSANFYAQQNVANVADPLLIDTTAGKSKTLSKITLVNHSKNSGFTEVSSSSFFSASGPVYNTNVGKSKEQLSKRNEMKFPRCMQTKPTTPVQEDLLTSERTHFRPIKPTYIDGYTFSIPNDLDEVVYTRSASGSLYLDSDKYMEYNPIAGGDSGDSLAASDEDDLVLKFCVKQNEKCCQTDENTIDQYVLSVNKGISTGTSSSSITYQSLTPIVAATAIDIDMEYDELNFGQQFNSEIIDNFSGRKLDMENWTIGMNNKKCLNNNNNPHALWEHCAACKCDVVSLPANRLLKAELNADGDEIMSELYMQNLYIGSDWGDEDDDDGDIEDNEEDVNSDDLDDDYDVDKVNSDDPLELNDNGEAKEHFYNVNKLISELLKPETAKSLAQAIGSTQGKNILEEIALNESKYPTSKHMATQKWINLNNRNYENIFMAAADASLNKFNNLNDDLSEKYIGGLWSNDNVRNIWQKEMKTSIVEAAVVTNAIDVNNIWSNNNETSVPIHQTLAAKKIITDNQNWEHSNLEHIWNGDENNGQLDAKSSYVNAEQVGDFKSLNDNFRIAKRLKEEEYFACFDQHELSYDNETLKTFINEQQYSHAGNDNNNGNGLDKNMDNGNSLHAISDAKNNKRCDRKRRHSASQNLNDALEIVECAERKLTSIGGDSLNVTAIITCNYWPTNTSTDDAPYLDGGKYHHHHHNNNENNNNNNYGMMEINPSASILKHIPVVSRPLTR